MQGCHMEKGWLGPNFEKSLRLEYFTKLPGNWRTWSLSHLLSPKKNSDFLVTRPRTLFPVWRGLAPLFDFGGPGCLPPVTNRCRSVSFSKSSSVTSTLRPSVESQLKIENLFAFHAWLQLACQLHWTASMNIRFWLGGFHKWRHAFFGKIWPPPPPFVTNCHNNGNPPSKMTSQGLDPPPPFTEEKF